jgi:hypothetical protein
LNKKERPRRARDSALITVDGFTYYKEDFEITTNYEQVLQKCKKEPIKMPPGPSPLSSD